MTGQTSLANPILSALRYDIQNFATLGEEDKWYDQYLSDDFTGEQWEGIELSPEDISFAQRVIHGLRHRFRVTEMTLHAVRESNGNLLLITSDYSEARSTAVQDGDTIESFVASLPIRTETRR